MATYSPEQISKYLSCIGLDASVRGLTPSLEHLTYLIKHHLATVPFETLSLHYSKTHLLSLEPDDLYQKMVGTSRGGYCMENNTLFGTILRTLGYKLISTGARVSYALTGRDVGGRFMGWNHMLNLVTIDTQRYLVDVGLGGSNPCRPIPLISGDVLSGVGAQQLKVELRNLPYHGDADQRVWVYSCRANEEAQWVDAYCFTETEFFTEDFEVMNLATMTRRQSFFTQQVFAIKFVLDDETGELDGQLILIGKEVKTTRGGPKVVETLTSEQERVKALKQYFGISLSEQEQRAIHFLSSEIRG